MPLIWLLICTLMMSFSLATAGTLQGMVVGVSDGDTLTLLVAKRQHKVRMQHIDCPESKQNYGTVARQALADLVFQKHVTVVTTEKDRYGRWIGLVILPDGTSVNHRLVWSGHCWWYPEFSDDDVFATLEFAARQEKMGLWEDPNAVSPWEWRKTEKARRKK